MLTNQHLIAVVNAGSATLKFSLLGVEDTVLKILIERLGQIGEEGPRAVIKDAQGGLVFDGPIPVRNHGDALAWLFAWIGQERPGLKPVAVGHRVVHGGDSLRKPTLVTPEVIELIESLVPLAPLHQPHNLSPIRFIARRFPELPQVACFDTAFHASQSKIERMFALPRWWSEKGIKRYGFHGLSYEYIASRLPEIDEQVATGRTIVCHLGNGASLCGIHAGRSVATTMAFTALEGLPMGTRCGSIDPGVLLYLLDQENLAVGELSDLLYKQSGLLGISGISSDMRDLLSDPGDEAAEAVEYFCYRIARDIGSLAAALGGLDALVFTGGIGEHAAPVRARVCELSQWLGIAIDPVANAEDRNILHSADSSKRVLVIPTNEEMMIAMHVRQLIGI
ncbi:MAG: acetate/propionate family kinase [Proteobacteria bacterium]|nr:acetate/propionate family kinase [Pseudomonadota bacterium]